jgi:hypothetical protein
MAVVGTGSPASAQSVSVPSRTCGEQTASPLLKGTLHSIAHVPDKTSLAILSLGAAGALGAHAADSRVRESFHSSSLDRALKPGATIGGMPFQVSSSAVLMALGTATHHPCLASLGSELLQAQVIGAAWTAGLKQAVQRDRPEGKGLSFPSGHTATAFASATVLQRRFGWKVGIPAYGVASYVAASRVEMHRHYLSDVAFGAALGIVAGRTVGIGHGHELMVTPLATPHGGGIGFSLLPPK